MSNFLKGDFIEIDKNLTKEGKQLLDNIKAFQQKIQQFNTNATIGIIRNAIVAKKLGYDIVNQGKHGFAAKTKCEKKFLEIKHCSLSSKKWVGIWNDTNEEKANSFKDKRLYTAVALWQGASKLIAICYGQNDGIGDYLLERIENRKPGSRSTQIIDMRNLIVKYNFKMVAIDEKKENVYRLLEKHTPSISKYITEKDIYELSDL